MECMQSTCDCVAHSWSCHPLSIIFCHRSICSSIVLWRLSCSRLARGRAPRQQLHAHSHGSVGRCPQPQPQQPQPSLCLPASIGQHSQQQQQQQQGALLRATARAASRAFAHGTYYHIRRGHRRSDYSRRPELWVIQCFNWSSITNSESNKRTNITVSAPSHCDGTCGQCAAVARIGLTMPRKANWAARAMVRRTGRRVQW